MANQKLIRIEIDSARHDAIERALRIYLSLYEQMPWAENFPDARRFLKAEGAYLRPGVNFISVLRDTQCSVLDFSDYLGSFWELLMDPDTGVFDYPPSITAQVSVLDEHLNGYIVSWGNGCVQQRPVTNTEHAAV